MTKQLRNEHNWLSGIEKSLYSQQTLSEDPDELNEQLNLNEVGCLFLWNMMNIKYFAN